MNPPGKERLNLSVVVLTKNEERNIRACLQSVTGLADEIVVVDDESLDKTVQIASLYTDRIIVRKMDIEGRQRNFAYAQAQNQWVLSLDADERLSEDLKSEIREALNGQVKYNGFTIPRRNFIGDYWVRYGGWYPSAQLKLFKKDKFRYEEVGVHPRAFMDDPCGHLKKDLIHYSYRNLEDFLGKLNNQTTREAQKWLSQNKPMTLVRFVYRSIDRFLRTYIGRKGYKDGFIGLAVAFYASLYQFISYLKYKELIIYQERMRSK
ncbi:MAG: glycosyltransferase family 2 protein [Candidatus Omnitrophica bacterium]|nr:glycosyltransferase family 2 protein [Candidatus Omnitrophota bacterium]